MGVSSEQSYRNMNRLLVACAFVACAFGAPMPEADADYAHGLVAAAPVAAVAAAGAAVGYAGGAVVGAPVAHAPAVVGQTHHSSAAGQETIPQPATSYVAGAPQNIVETVPIAPPA